MEWTSTDQQSTITKVELQKKNKHRFNIYLNEEFAFAIHEDIMIKHHLFKGTIIDAARMIDIMQEEEQHSAYLAGVLYLGRGPRSEKEVRRKLKEKGYEGECSDKAIDRLKEHRYIDDNAFAKQWADHRVNFGRKGRNFVRQELAAKGLGKNEIAGAMESIDEDDEYEGALALGAKKWRSASGEYIDKKRKTMGYLLRRGYVQGVVNRVIREVSQQTLEESGFDD
ncbi:RecX family transcriptional regulator [Paenibacillus sp. N1-5-1-14]|uniref:regulatory protein RecX n=1 Tax=Paenibacillus radicibacter TaxID=2972488 RepID=UPI0021597138|nr:RecX family transcriptional regulator [Paenibacillus radicibacter]MCR8642116.1 RecX family transcriptional regulator [Paenibacillus radicibacter]